VGLAIERAGLAVEDKDRAKGTYFLSPAKAESGWLDKLQFWKDSKGTNAHYRVNIKDGGAACEVSVTGQNGASDDATRQMIEVIYKNIDQ
jgi:outer membrane protein assembly factor BamC